MNLVESGDGERWNQGYQIRDDDIFPWVFNERDIAMGLLEKGCMQDYKLKQIKNGFLIKLGRYRYSSRRRILLMSPASPSAQKLS